MMRNIWGQKRTPWIFLTILIVQFGCTHTRPNQHPPKQVMEKFGSIGVVHAHFIPKFEYETPAKGWAAGAGKGAAKGVLGTVGTFPDGFVADPIIGIIVSSVAATVGGVTGGLIAESKDKVEENAAILNKFNAELKVQETMSNRFLKLAKEQTESSYVVFDEQGPSDLDEKINYGFLADKGIDTVFEISVLNYGLTDPYVNSPIAFFMNLRLRLIRTIDGKVIHNSTIRYESKKHRFSDWSANNAQTFREEFNTGYQNLSERIIDKILCLPELNSDSLDICGPQPISPVCRYNLEFLKKEVKCAAIDSIQPTLKWTKWTSFSMPPNGSDRVEKLPYLNDISYDIKVYRIENDFPVELVYEKNNLTDCFHKIERSLSPSTTYFWTVRARHKVDGNDQATKWYLKFRKSLTGLSGISSNCLTTTFDSRFVTPPK
jgi:hypothetical protein